MTYRCVNRWSEFRWLGSGGWVAFRGSVCLRVWAGKWAGKWAVFRGSTCLRVWVGSRHYTMTSNHPVVLSAELAPGKCCNSLAIPGSVIKNKLCMDSTKINDLMTLPPRCRICWNRYIENLFYNLYGTVVLFLSWNETGILFYLSQFSLTNLVF